MTNTTNTPTIVLVHGGFADASFWTPVIQELQGRGLPVLAPPNPLRDWPEGFPCAAEAAPPRRRRTSSSLQAFCGIAAGATMDEPIGFAGGSIRAGPRKGKT